MGFWALPAQARDRPPRTPATADGPSCSRECYGDVALPEPWRLLGPIEATVGVLMLGWSTGILVTVIGVIYGRLFHP